MDFIINNFFGIPDFTQNTFRVQLLLILLWSLLWKGLALWNSSKNDQKNWFIAILVLNTLGVLEIAYLFYFAKKRLKLEDIQLLLKQKVFIKIASNFVIPA